MGTDYYCPHCENFHLPDPLPNPDNILATNDGKVLWPCLGCAIQRYYTQARLQGCTTVQRRTNHEYDVST